MVGNAQPELVQWVKERLPIGRSIFLTHGEEQGQRALAEDLRGLGVVLGLPGVHGALHLAHDHAGDLDQPVPELVDAAADSACRLRSHELSL